LNAIVSAKAELESLSTPTGDGLGDYSRSNALPMEIIAVDPLSDARWDVWIRSHPDCGIFHSAAWGKVLSRTYSHMPRYLRICQGEETIALVPMMEVRSIMTGRRGVCLPFSDLCGPLVFDRSHSGPILDALSKLAVKRKWKYFEIRGSMGLRPPAEMSVAFLHHTLVLGSGAEKLFGSFATLVRRMIRKAERSGLEVRVLKTREAVLDFYRLHCRTRKRHGVPPQPLSFFLNIYEEIIKQGMGFIVLASDGFRQVAGAVFFYFERKAIYKFAASDPSGIGANNLVMWEGIKELKRRGARHLHFGRTSCSNDGLRRYKRSWGANEEPVYYARFDTTSRSWSRVKPDVTASHEHLFRRMPLVVNRLAGTLLYPHLH